MYRTTTLVGGKRTVIVGVAVSMFVSAGVAAAATGAAPWTAEAPPSDAPAITATTVTTPSPASEPTTAPTAPPVAGEVPGPIITTTLPSEPGSDTSTTVFLYVPPTSPIGDTQVPEGISLTCTQDGATVTCSWSGVDVAGFSEFLVLRGDGTLGRVPFRTSDPGAGMYVDTGLAPGSYSYVVVAMDQDSKTLVHSNGVHVEIAAAG